MADEPRVGFSIVAGDGETDFEDMTADVAAVALREVEVVAGRLETGNVDHVALQKSIRLRREELAVDASRIQLEREMLDAERRRNDALDRLVKSREEAEINRRVDVVLAEVAKGMAEKEPEPVRRGRVVPRKSKRKPDPTPLEILQKKAGLA